MKNEKSEKTSKKSPLGLILWLATLACLVLTVVFWNLSRNQNIEYDEVTAVVTSASTTEVVNKNTGSRTPFYDVKVRYEGQEYSLENVHGLAGYSEGRSVKVLLSNGKLYANVEGITSTTPISIVYFVFLFGTFAMLMIAATYSSKQSAKKKAAQESSDKDTDSKKSVESGSAKQKKN